ncbi:uncharacterized protein EI97DRAFT_451049 [Westerdykella ornata]|uniref:FAD/NAD(P)-binding domain-containing protein n=1 Tax=Westerdykella ornata TaxID=318751 RepID=A0A6A6JGF9_WESOR|nr:uncharacterized protein EI97DRAFT_451049 [Westerdykella ornata]KAF2275502.1 hypothetical protein EI97DRAFT_451049 [Westerdykella ornata]
MASSEAAAAAPQAHEVVVLGGNFAGIQVTHYLLRRIFPRLERLKGSGAYHIYLVSPNSHYFFKIAAPRALTKPEVIKKIFKPIDQALGKYGQSCDFIRGKAISLNPMAKTVTICTVPNATHRVLRYDSLFICTGTTTASPLWTLHDDHLTTRAEFTEMHMRLPQTNTLLIAGGGPVGVETAGEIAAAYPTMNITLVAGGDVLPNLPESVRTKAKSRLREAGDASTSATGTEVTLSDWTQMTVDTFIDCRGATRINSEYLPAVWLDSRGRVFTRDKYLRVRGDNSAPADGVYAVGDIVSGSANTALELDAMVFTAGSSFGYDISTQLGFKPKPVTTNSGVLQKNAESLRNTTTVPIGPNDGVGLLLGLPLPSLAVKMIKGKSFMTTRVEPIVTGAQYLKKRQKLVRGIRRIFKM